MKKIVYTLILLAFTSMTSAQWQPDARLTNASGYSYTSWTKEGLKSNGNILHFVWYDDRDGNNEIYYKRSIDGGVTWETDTRLTNNSSNSHNPSLLASGSNLQVVWCDYRDGNGSEVYHKRSTDYGTTWGADTRLTNASSYSSGASLSESASLLHLIWYDNRDGNQEIYYKSSTDGGTTWGNDTRLTNAAGNSLFPDVSISGSTLHVVWYDGRDGNNEIYYKRSTDAGITWGTDTRLSNNTSVSELGAVSASGQVVHVVWYDNFEGNYEIYYKRSTNGGTNWEANTRLSNNSANSSQPDITVSGSNVNVVWQDNRDGKYEIYYKNSTNSGLTWGADTRLTTTNTTDNVKLPQIHVSGSSLHVVWSDTRDGNFEIYYKKNPTGIPPTGVWVQKSNGLPTNIPVVCFILNGTNLFAGTWGDGVYLSTNYGDNWISYSNGLPIYIYNFAVNENNLFAATGQYGVFKSTNNGTNWTQVNNGLTDIQILNLAVKGNDLYAGTYDYGIFRSTNNGNTWINCLNTPRIYDLYVMGSNIFAGTHYNGVFRSTDNGSNWVSINNGINYPVFYGFTSIANNLFAGTRNGGIFLTTNNGDIWNAVNNGLIYNGDMKVVSKDSALYAGLSGTSGGMFISTNKGGNWAAMNQGFNTIPGINRLSIINNYIFAGTTSGVWRRDIPESIGIQNISTEVPSVFSLQQNYPNPFNPSTKIRFAITSNVKGETSNAKLIIFDILGREVSTLVNVQLKPGTYEVDWDGISFASGVYYYKLISGEFVETKKMILLK